MSVFLYVGAYAFISIIFNYRITTFITILMAICFTLIFIIMITSSYLDGILVACTIITRTRKMISYIKYLPMCMSIEYHLYLLHFFYHTNDYNLFIIFVFMFMGGSMSAVMLLLCYLPMTMIIIKLSIVLYCIYNLIIV